MKVMDFFGKYQLKADEIEGGEGKYLKLWRFMIRID